MDSKKQKAQKQKTKKEKLQKEIKKCLLIDFIEKKYWLENLENIENLPIEFLDKILKIFSENNKKIDVIVEKSIFNNPENELIPKINQKVTALKKQAIKEFEKNEQKDWDRELLESLKNIE
ncbi:hypothetical protein GF340_04030 [Candidatus Peregrinibacteria bacterium]|nr:hypothetical protein [Candidatus Peregrinibacteria bacterium]